MKFDYSAVQDDVEQVEAQLKKINRALSDLQNGLDIITSLDNWNAPSEEYVSQQCKKLYSSFDQVGALSKNINGYLSGILTNYKNTDDNLNNLFMSLFKGGK